MTACGGGGGISPARSSGTSGSAGTVTFTPGTGTGTGTGTTTGPSTTGGTGTTSGAQPVTLTVSPTSIAFGNVLLGSTRTIQISVGGGSSQVTLTKATSTDPQFTLVNAAFPLTVGPNQTIPLNIMYAPNQVGVAAATFTFTADQTSASFEVSATGNASPNPTTQPVTSPGTTTTTPTPVASLTADSQQLNFGNVPIGGSVTLPVTLLNNGTVFVSIQQIASSAAGFTVKPSAILPLNLGPQQSTRVDVTFTPTVTGFAGGTMNVLTNPAGASFSLAISGNGLAAQPSGPGTGTGTPTPTPTPTPTTPSKGTVVGLTANPTTLAFGDVTTGQTQTAQITVINGNSTPITISDIATDSPLFSIGGIALPFVMNANGLQTFTVTFAPLDAGVVSSTIVLTTDPAASSISITATGNGVAPPQVLPALTVAPTTLSFGSVLVGTAQSLQVVVQNTGTTDVTLQSASIQGAGFNLSNTAFPVTIATGSSATFNVVFSPTVVGNANATINVATNPSSTAFTLTATGSGNGGNIKPSPATITFPDTVVGASSAQPVTVLNNSPGTVTLLAPIVVGSGISVTGQTFPLVLNANQSATFNVVFTPTLEGAMTGALQFSTDPLTASFTVNLSGTALPGIPPPADTTTGTKTVATGITATPNVVLFDTLLLGASQTVAIKLQNNSSSPVTLVNADLTGAGFSISGLVFPVIIPAGQTSGFNFTFSPTIAGTVNGAVSFTTDPASAAFSVTASAVGTAPQSALTIVNPLLPNDPTFFDFGMVLLGTNAQRQAVVTASGTASVVISGLTLPSTVTVSGLAVGDTLTPNKPVTCTLTYTPSAAGQFSDVGIVLSNATNPSASILLSATAITTHTVDINWDASTSSVVGYNIYRSDQSAGPYSKLTVTPATCTSFSDQTALGGHTYFYAVTAVAADGTESDPTAAVSASVPAP